MTDFKAFADNINTQFRIIQAASELFTAKATGDELYAAYLAAFPEGSNPLFRERTEHDCSNCRGFIKNFGGVISINPSDLRVDTVWDMGLELPFPYGEVATQMRAFVVAQAQEAIDLFRVGQPSFSAHTTRTATDAGIETYSHLYGQAVNRYVAKDSEQVGTFNTSIQVFSDSLERLTLDAVDTVLDLIKDKQLYRGDEHLSKLRSFRGALEMHRSLPPVFQRRYVAVTAAGNIGLSRFKNSVIGSLVEDLSDGVDLEAAVRSFESKVAPANYQRTSQVVSQRMVDDALKTIDDLGLKIGRRMAKLDDISVNNVLWVDNASRPLMKDGLAGLLAGAVKPRPVAVADKNVTEIGIDQFLADVLPGARELNVLIEPALSSSFVTLTTATEAGGPDLFKWNNPFAWSYAGGVTDAITERVKAAGGNIKAALRFSLSWTNTDDLDLSVAYHEPSGRLGQLISFRQKRSYINGLVGGLDVDMNVSGETRTPVENIAFTQLRPGTYVVMVHNFTKRENKDVGFTLQVADGVGSTDYFYPQAVNGRQIMDCLEATVDAQGNVTYKVSPTLTKTSAQITGEKWGIPFGQFAAVHAVTLSPNHWDDNAVGNKHWFFLLKDAKADEQPRGLYNEYLSGALAKHRKVFDVIGDRTKPLLTDEQLSGIGVSSTLRKTVTVQVVSASAQRLYRIQF